jgi:CRISPR/Cas system-associated endoribonuclease Cas2
MHQQALLTVPAQIRGVRKLTRQLEHIADEDVDSVVIAPIDERADKSLIFIGKTGDPAGPALTCYLNREIGHVN